MTKLDIIKKWFEGEEIEYYSYYSERWSPVYPYVDRNAQAGTLPTCIQEPDYDLRVKPKSKYMNLFEDTVTYPHWVEGERETPPKTDGCIGYLLDKHGDGSDIIFVRESV